MENCLGILVFENMIFRSTQACFKISFCNKFSGWSLIVSFLLCLSLLTREREHQAPTSRHSPASSCDAHSTAHSHVAYLSVRLACLCEEAF